MRKERDDLRAAIVALDRAIDDAPTHATAYFDRARAKALLLDHSGAIEDLGRHLALAPADAAAFRARAFCRLDEAPPARAARAVGDFESAVALDLGLEAALRPWIDVAGRLRELDEMGAIEELAALYGERARALLEEGDVANAALWFFRGIDVKKDDAASWCGRGVARRRLGRCREALRDLDRAIELEPELAAAYVERARAKSDLSDVAGAADDLSYYLSFFPADALVWLELGGVRLRLGLREEANVALRRAIELKPDLRTAVAKTIAAGDDEVVLRARDLFMRGEDEAALAVLDDLLSHQPDHPSALWWRALVYGELGRHGDAIADWDRALPLWGDNAALGHYSRGTSRFTLKRYAAALADFDVFLRAEPIDPEGLHYRALTLQKLGRWQEAMRDAEELLRTLPDDVKVRRLHAHVAMMLGHHEAAIEDYDVCLAANPLDADIWFARTFRCLDAARYEDAVDSAKQAYHLELRREPTYVMDFVARASKSKGLELARLCCERGGLKLERRELATARIWFTRALEAKPDHGPALLGRGAASFEAADYASALADLGRAVLLDSKRRTPHVDDQLRIAEQRLRAAPSGAEVTSP